MFFSFFVVQLLCHDDGRLRINHKIFPASVFSVPPPTSHGAHLITLFRHPFFSNMPTNQYPSPNPRLPLFNLLHYIDTLYPVRQEKLEINDEISRNFEFSFSPLSLNPNRPRPPAPPRHHTPPDSVPRSKTVMNLPSGRCSGTA